MKAKHLTKNTMSHKLVFLAVGIAIAIIAAFSICATGTAIADSNNQANDAISSVKVIDTNPGSEGKPHDGFVTGWHDPQEATIADKMEWTSGLDVITEYAKGHKVEYIEYFVPSVTNITNVLTINLYEEESGYVRNLSFTCVSVENYSWYIGKKMVTPARSKSYKNATFTCAGEAPTVSNISGKVIDANGVAVSGALVEFSSKAPVNAFNLGEHSTTTGADGSFELTDISEDEFPGYITITKDGFEPYTSTEITKVQAESGDIDLSDIKLTLKEPIPPSPDPTPEPTPNTNATVSGRTPQTGDGAGAAFAVLGLLMLASSGFLTARKLYAK